MKTALFRRILLTLAAGTTGAVFVMAPAGTTAAPVPSASATTQSFQISPPTANQLILRELTSLRGIRLLAEVIRRQILGHNRLNIVSVHRLRLQTRDLAQHHAY